MKLICTKCDQPIGESDVNVAEGFCYCRICREAFKIASFLTETELVQRTTQPPASKIKVYEQEEAFGFVIPAGGSGWNTVFFLIFSLIWNFGSWGVFLTTLSESDWWTRLFLIPFLVVGLVALAAFLFFWKGVFTFMINRQECVGLWSVFDFRYRKAISRNEITGVTEEAVYTQNYQPVYGVCISYADNKKMKFGSSLSEDERIWLEGEIKYFMDQYPVDSAAT